MPYVWVLHAVAAVLLVGAGLPRILRPEGMVAAAREIGLPGVVPTTARLVGAAEAAIGLWALVVGGAAAAAAVALCYLGFAVVTAVGVVRGAASCGCFVGDDAEPTYLHVAVDAVLATAAAIAAVGSVPGVLSLLDTDGTGATAGLLAVAALDAVLVYLVLTRFPRGERAASVTA